MIHRVEMSVESILELIRHGCVVGTNPVPLIDDLLAAIRTDDKFAMLRTKREKPPKPVECGHTSFHDDCASCEYLRMGH